MDEKKLAELTDEELLEEAKKMKSNAVTTAVFIGFLVGIIIYSVAVNSVGWFSIIPLYLVYKLINNSNQNEALEKLLKERNLK